MHGSKGDARSTTVCVCYVRGIVFTGQDDGALYRWTGRNVSDVKAGAHKGAVRCLHAVGGTDTFLSGGADGRVHLWDAFFSCKRSFDASSPLPSVDAALSAVAMRDNTLVFGTRGGEITRLRMNPAGGEEAVERLVEVRPSGAGSARGGGVEAGG